MMVPSKNQTRDSSLFISTEELAKMERLLAGLLKTATPEEQAKILKLHKQLKNLYEAQSEDRERFKYLQKLVE